MQPAAADQKPKARMTTSGVAAGLRCLIGMPLTNVTPKGSAISEMGDKYRHVMGHFEPAESQFVILHMKERMYNIRCHLEVSRRLWVLSTLALALGGAMISPMIMDYIRLCRLESQVRSLRATVAEAKIKSRSLDIALHDV